MSPAEVAELESEYVAHRGLVLAMLRSEYGGLAGEHEELYQEAWTELLEFIRRGGSPQSTTALLKTIARRRARDLLRNRSAESVDPTGVFYSQQVDQRELPDEVAQVHLDAASLRHVVDSLDPRQAAAIKLRFDRGLSGREIQRELGVSAKRLEKIVTQAYETIAQELMVEDGDSPWSRRQRSLLMACEMGIATPDQEHRARRMLQDDPACRAMLRTMRRALRDVSVVLPVPALPELTSRADGSVVDRLHGVAHALRDTLAGWLSRAPSGGVGEQVAGAGSAGVGGALAAKAVIACLAVGGAAVCASTFVGGHRDAARQPDVRAVGHAKARTPPRATSTRAPTSSGVGSTARAARSTSSKSATSSPKARPAASPAPRGSNEFAPSQTAAANASARAASAPADGGGEFAP